MPHNAKSLLPTDYYNFELRSLFFLFFFPGLLAYWSILVCDSFCGMLDMLDICYAMPAVGILKCSKKKAGKHCAAFLVGHG